MMTLFGYFPIRRHRAACSWRAATMAALAAALLGGGPFSCVYDPDDRCSPGQVFDEGRSLCVCAEGYAFTNIGCVKCGDHEIPGGQGCACAPGYARPSADVPCAAVPEGLGAACDTPGMPCGDPKYSMCHSDVGMPGYCTNGCTAQADCEGGYACATMATPPFCRRPPTGAGQACMAPADCAGKEASFCDAVMTHQCLVPGCTLTPDNCFEGTQCCDLSMFTGTTLCVAKGTCPL